jgi:hypothetical protein
MPFEPASFVAELIQVILSQFHSSIGGITPPPLPANASFPYITVNEIRVGEIESLYGLSGVQQVVMQVNVWDKDFEEASVLRNTIKRYLCSYSGTAGSRVIQGVNPVVDTTLHDGVRNLHQSITRVKVTWGS